MTSSLAREVRNYTNEEFYCYSSGGEILKFEGTNKKKLPEPIERVVLIVDAETLAAAKQAGRTTIDLAQICKETPGRGGVLVHNIEMCDFIIEERCRHPKEEHRRVYPFASCANEVTNF